MNWFFLQPIFLQNIFFDLRSVVFQPWSHHLFFFCVEYAEPRLISSCSSGSDLYALSRHRCCSFLLFSGLVLYDDGRRLITALSTTSVTSLISWVLAEDITTDIGIPSLSVKMCLFVPSLLLSVGLLPVSAPPMVIWQIYCQWIAKSIWYQWGYHRFSTV